MTFNHLRIRLFSFFSLYMYSPVPLIGESEVFPWYVLPILSTLKKDYLFIFINIFILATAFAYFNFIISINIFQFGISFLACKYISDMSCDERAYFLKSIENLIIYITVFMFLQRVLPDYFAGLSDLFSFRSGESIDHRTGGVRGVAPEPSYMAASIFAVFLIHTFLSNFKINFLFFGTSFFAILLIGSLMGIILALSFILLLLLSNFFDTLSKLFSSKFLKLRNYKFFSSFFFILFFILTFFYPMFESSFLRFFELISDLKINKEFLSLLLDAEDRLGSARISEVIHIFSLEPGYFIGFQYDKPFSMFGLIASLFSPFHYLVILYLVFKAWEIRSLYYFYSICIFAMIGPMSFYGLMIGLFYKKKESNNVF